jgi:ATPase subunit of ABC transporter with duplicated ATPase domains
MAQREILCYRNSMISTSNVSLSFGGRKLFEDVNIKFTPGQCYGLIGANGAGKSTFLKILSGEIEQQTGEVFITPGERLSVLRQDHFKFDEYRVLDTVIMGNQELYKVMKEKDEIYAKADFSDADGIRASELEGRFAELNGWEAEADAAVLLAGLGLGVEFNDKLMKELSGAEKVKVLLAQALIGTPDILLLDEPTNHLDMKAINWLENFLLNFKNTVIVVSHDRHFLNKVCTHMADIDFGKITIYAGNYDFWRQSSELAMRLRSNENKKAEDKAAELKAFIMRFSANASKSKQATSRQKQLEKLQLIDMPVSTRKYPFVQFAPKREAGKDILKVEGISKTIEGVKILDKVSFTVNKGDKIVFLGESDLAITVLFEILCGKMQADSGSFTWGVTTTQSYFPSDNSAYFDNYNDHIINWLTQYSEEKHETFMRGFLGKMLFSGEEALKKTKVLSGGERVRCMLSKMMLSGANVLVMDGPTSHLDLESITAVNDGLIRFKGTILFSSHDHEFVQTVANRFIKINKTVVDDVTDTTFDAYMGLE